MTIKPEMLRAMLNAGCSAEQLVIFAEDFEKAGEAKRAERRAKNAERQRRHRERNGMSRVTERDSAVTASLPEVGAAPSKPRSDLAEFKAELHDVSAANLEAIIKHRRTKQAALTGNAARLFRSAAEACGLTLDAAIDTCIERNWITVKPEWLTPKPNFRNHSNGNRTRTQAAADLLQELEHGRQGQGNQSHSRDVELLPSAGGLRSRYAASGVPHGRG